ncbi:MAG: hypothetical protein Q7U06_01910 [Pseudomonadota bacterium]|nr:hypothetical protein [Pseudomonadota bacterium]
MRPLTPRAFRTLVTRPLATPPLVTPSQPTPTMADRLDGTLAPGVVRVDEGGVHAEVDVVDVDRLGVSVRGVKVRTDSGTGDVVDHAARLPRALGALADKLRPIEVDPTLGGAVLRSKVRRQEYFEVRSDGREVSVEKLRRGPDGRAAVPFTLTREQLGRLVEDVGEALAEEE